MTTIYHLPLYHEILTLRDAYVATGVGQVQRFESTIGTFIVYPNRLSLSFYKSTLNIAFIGLPGDARDVLTQFIHDGMPRLMAVVDFLILPKKEGS